MFLVRCSYVGKVESFFLHPILHITSKNPHLQYRHAMLVHANAAAIKRWNIPTVVKSLDLWKRLVGYAFHVCALLMLQDHQFTRCILQPAVWACASISVQKVTHVVERDVVRSHFTSILQLKKILIMEHHSLERSSR